MLVGEELGTWKGSAILVSDPEYDRTGMLLTPLFFLPFMVIYSFICVLLIRSETVLEPLPSSGDTR